MVSLAIISPLFLEKKLSSGSKVSGDYIYITPMFTFLSSFLLSLHRDHLVLRRKCQSSNALTLAIVTFCLKFAPSLGTMPIVTRVARVKRTAEDLPSAALAKADVRKARIAAAASRLEMRDSSVQRRASARRGRPNPVVSVPAGTSGERTTSAVVVATVPPVAPQSGMCFHNS